VTKAKKDNKTQNEKITEKVKKTDRKIIFPGRERKSII
jgi:hypothetical protein